MGWETGVQADLVAADVIEVGVAYKDGPFSETVTIGGATTDAHHFRRLTVADGQRHNGTAFSGATLVSGGDFKIEEDYVVVEWMVIQDFSGNRGLNPKSSFATLRYNVLDANGLGATGIDVEGDNTTVHNNIVYHTISHAIDAKGNSNVYYNNTLMGLGTGIGHGFKGSGGSLIVKNTISVGFEAGKDFESSFDAASENNLSSDGTAPGANPQIDTAANLFVNLAPSAENLHLQGGNAVDTAVDLSASIPDTDIDNQVRPAGAQWDIGADELGAATAVTLISFTARALDSEALLEWETGSELHNLGFHVYRAYSKDGPYERITEALIPGLGSSPEGARYRYRDAALANGTTYFYRLQDVETTGRTELHGPVSATPEAGNTDESDEERPDEPPVGPSGSTIVFGEPSASTLRVLHQSSHHTVLELVTRGFYAEPQEDGSVRLFIPGFAEEMEADAMAIPVKRTSIQAVAGRKVRLATVRASDIVAFSSLSPSATGSPKPTRPAGAWSGRGVSQVPRSRLSSERAYIRKKRLVS